MLKKLRRKIIIINMSMVGAVLLAIFSAYASTRGREVSTPPNPPLRSLSKRSPARRKFRPSVPTVFQGSAALTNLPRTGREKLPIPP